MRGTVFAAAKLGMLRAVGSTWGIGRLCIGASRERHPQVVPIVVERSCGPDNSMGTA